MYIFPTVNFSTEQLSVSNINDEQIAVVNDLSMVWKYFS